MADDTASRPQPVLYSQVVTAVTAVLGLLAAFGLPLTERQQEAILTTFAALVPMVALAGALWARQKVTPLSDPRNNAGDPLVVEPPAAGPTPPRPATRRPAAKKAAVPPVTKTTRGRPLT